MSNKDEYILNAKIDYVFRYENDDYFDIDKLSYGELDVFFDQLDKKICIYEGLIKKILKLMQEKLEDDKNKYQEL